MTADTIKAGFAACKTSTERHNYVIKNREGIKSAVREQYPDGPVEASQIQKLFSDAQFFLERTLAMTISSLVGRSG